MDCRITKKRLSEFLAYEWIIIVAVIVAVIIFWEFIYSTTSVKLTAGQEFVYFYDSTVSSSDINGFHKIFNYGKEDDKNTFSYDVKNFYFESLNNEYYVLSYRLAIYLGDIIITDIVQPEEGLNSADSHIKNTYYNMYDLDALANDAKEYLSQFLSDQALSPLIYENLDEDKINEHFLKRLGRDNRVSAGEITVQDEYNRIKKLCKNLTDFTYLLENYPNLFYQSDVLKEGEFHRYGILPEKLTGGEKDANTYFRTANVDPENPEKKKYSVDNTVIMVFDLKQQQPYLQYETISFLTTVVRTFSNILG